MISEITTKPRFVVSTLLLLFCSIFANADGISIADKNLAKAVIIIDKNADEPSACKGRSKTAAGGGAE